MNGNYHNGLWFHTNGLEHCTFQNFCMFISLLSEEQVDEIASIVFEHIQTMLDPFPSSVNDMI